MENQTVVRVANALPFDRSSTLDEHVLTPSRIVRSLGLVTVLDGRGVVDGHLFPARVEAEYLHCCHSGTLNASYGFRDQLRPVPVRFSLDLHAVVTFDRVLGAVKLKVRVSLETADLCLSLLRVSILSSVAACLMTSVNVPIGVA